jgi:hypothetical protein
MHPPEPIEVVQEQKPGSMRAKEIASLPETGLVAGTAALWLGYQIGGGPRCTPNRVPSCGGTQNLFIEQSTGAGKAKTLAPP